MGILKNRNQKEKERWQTWPCHLREGHPVRHGPALSPYSNCLSGPARPSCRFDTSCFTSRAQIAMQSVYWCKWAVIVLAKEKKKRKKKQNILMFLTWGLIIPVVCVIHLLRRWVKCGGYERSGWSKSSQSAKEFGVSSYCVSCLFRLYLFRKMRIG
jgi:predicted nucleic acid-binding Zn ribbon protein